MGTRENKNAKIMNLRHPRKFKPAKIRACTVSYLHTLKIAVMLSYKWHKSRAAYFDYPMPPSNIGLDPALYLQVHCIYTVHIQYKTMSLTTFRQV